MFVSDFSSLAHQLIQKFFSKAILVGAVLVLLVSANNSAHAATIVVSAGGSLQAALNAAQCGDTIVLTAGATYTVAGLEQPFLLRYKGPCTNTDADYITVQSSLVGSLPPGQRITPAAAALMPKLVTNVSTPAVEVEPNAHHYRLIGLEIKNDGSVINQGLVNVGISSGGTAAATFATVPRYIEFDRCYVHSIEDGSDSIYGTGVRGFNIQGSNITIKNSRIAGFRGYFPGTQTPISSNGVLLGAGPGPYTVHNTYLEAWFVPLFTGGGPQWITNRATVSPGATASQATLSNVANIAVGTLIAFKVSGNPNFAYEVARVTSITGNTVTYVGQASVDGTGNPLVRNPNSPGDAVWEGDVVKDVTITRNDFVLNPVVAETIANLTGNFGKGCIELKLGKNVLIEGNVFSGPSLALTLTTRNQTDGVNAGANPWATLENITIRNNWKRETSTFHNGHILGIQMEDNLATSKRGHGMLIENNLFEGSTSPLAQIGGSDDVVFRHNTAVARQGNPDVSMQFGYAAANPGSSMQDNIVYNGEYGMNCQLGGMSACWPGLVMGKNVIVDNRSLAQQQTYGPLGNIYPGANFYPTAVSQIGFVNPAAGDWALGPASPYKGMGTNGSDPGVNMTTLLAAIGGTAPPPTPTPNPSPTPTPNPTPTPTPNPTPTPTPTPTPNPTPTPTPTPTPSPTPLGETVWVDDSVPMGANYGGDAESWKWVGTSPSPFSGGLANQSAVVSGMHQHYFFNATSTMKVITGETLFAYVFIDPANIPSQIMLQWNDGDWEQRAYWGTNNLHFGEENTNSLRRMGPLPPAGQWVRLEVPASQVGLAGKTVNGMAFTLYGGRATWDRAGKNLAGNGLNPIDLTDFFVRQHYLDFLGREPDPEGLAGWQNLINNCPPGDITCDRIHVSSGFYQSPEFRARGYFVYRFYSVSFGRKPDYEEFTPDFAKVSGFLSDTQLEAAKMAFVAEFIERPAFVAKFNGLSNTQYVDSLLSTAGIIHSARDFWIAALNDRTRTRAQVLREIAESTEVHNKYFNEAFVVMQYFGYLRRQPDAQYLNWILYLNSTGDFRSMISGFMNSVEYRSRFAP
jgi:parallel beta helix pectate lyase-like protein